jgi:inorganic pyrophosphatase
MKLDQLPLRTEDGAFNAIVETPRANRTKFAYDPETHLFRAKKLLPLGLAFPFPFGFLPSTKGGDGDPLDVLLMTDADLPIGTLVRIGVIGVIEAEQGPDAAHMVRNDRLLGVPMLEHQDRPPEKMSDIPEGELSEIETFFAAYQKANGKLFVVLRRSDAAAARQLVESAAI